MNEALPPGSREERPMAPAPDREAMNHIANLVYAIVSKVIDSLAQQLEEQLATFGADNATLKQQLGRPISAILTADLVMSGTIDQIGIQVHQLAETILRLLADDPERNVTDAFTIVTQRTVPPEVLSGISRIVQGNRETAHLIANLLQVSEVKYARALDAHTQRISHPALATRSAYAYNSVLISPQLWKAAIDGLDTGDWSALEAVQEEISRNGGMLIPMTEEQARERILDTDHWLLYRAGGHTYQLQKSRRIDPHRYTAEVHLHLTEDRPDAETYYFSPDHPSVTVTEDGQMIARDICENHATALCVADMFARQGYGHWGLVSAARHAAFEDVSSTINPARTHPFKYALAETFSAKGIVRDGTPHLFPYHIANAASQRANILSRKHSGILAWTVNDQHVTVDLPTGDQATFLVDWNVIAQTISQRTRKRRPQ